MRKLLQTAALALLLLAPAATAYAQDSAMTEYMQAMDRMSADMKKGMDQDATKAWAKMMIAHHQGAVDMSKTVLKETKDDTIRKMAQKGIAEQTKEIKELKDWLAKHGG